VKHHSRHAHTLSRRLAESQRNERPEFRRHNTPFCIPPSAFYLSRIPSFRRLSPVSAGEIIAWISGI
jgi:hypothetical protein